MALYKYPSSTFAVHGCRLVKDDDSYVDNIDERSVRLSPLVNIPSGYLLVGPTRNRLMQLHALLMCSDAEAAGFQDASHELIAQDVADIATGLMEHFGYKSILTSGLGKRRFKATPDELQALDEIAAQHGDFHRAVAGMVLSHGDEFRQAVQNHRVYLAREVVQGLGIRDQVSMEPLMWESRFLNSPNALMLMVWKIPSEPLLSMIDVVRSYPEMQRLAIAPAALDAEAYRCRQGQ